MVGVIAEYQGKLVSQRLIRDDVLDALYGKQSANPKALIEGALRLAFDLVEKLGFDKTFDKDLLGLHFGKLRQTEVVSVSDLMRQAALLHSSLASLDVFDDMEESDAPSQEDTNKRFVTEVKDIVRIRRPELSSCFNRLCSLTEDGQPVKFGFISSKSILHFSVINAARQSNGVRDARARLWELSNAQSFSHIPAAALITAVPRLDDPTLGTKQRKSLEENVNEIEREADSQNMRFVPVSSATEGANKVLEYAE